MKTYPAKSSGETFPRARILRQGFGGALCLVALSSFFSPSDACAATLYWDSNGSSSGVGGTGVWNASNTNWATAWQGTGTPVVWDGSVDAAVFEGASGTVTVSAAVTAKKLLFNAGGFTLGGTGPLTVASTIDNNIVDVTANATSGITFNIALNVNGSLRNVNGDGNFTIRSAAAANLVFNEAITFTGAGGASTSGIKYLNIEQNNAGGKITLNNTVSASNLGGSTFRLRFRGVNGAEFHLNGNNSTLGGTTSIGRGVLHVGNNNALGSSFIVLGDSGYTTNGDTLKLFADEGVTIDNLVFVTLGSSVTTSTGATVVIGGDSAGQSTYSAGISIDKYQVNLEAAQNGRVDFSGVVSGAAGGSGFSAGSIQKTGAGIVRLTRAAGNTYTGGTSVNEGVLVLANTTDSATGTGAVTVKAGATLAGTGIATGAVTAESATSVFSAGDMAINGTSAIGTLNLIGGLAASNGATFKVDINGANADRFDFGAAAVTLGNTVHFDIKSVGSGISTGVAYSFFAGSGTWSGTPTFTFSTPNGYALDTSYGGGKGYIWDAAGNSFTVQFTVSSIPEPGSYALLFGGMALAAVMMVRRRAMRG